VLYRLGRACSKLATTLLIKMGETKKLNTAKQYREMCEVFLKRGAELEPVSARFPTALAYRYYSNVHELMRPGERRDQDIEKEIEKANEWLSRALEIYPQSVRNHYRKGKLIIEKQAPYLLFGKRAFGAREAELLREIREVGEEHLATSISLYEALEDTVARERDRREYAKALFVLGGYYLDDAYLPVHEYFLRRIAGREDTRPVAPISKLDAKTAVELLEKAFCTETEMSLDKLDVEALSEKHKEWTRSPVEKLYKLGCAYSAMAFVSLTEGNEEQQKGLADKALKYLQAAKDVADKSQDRKRNTWHISEKLAWIHIYMGQYDKAARLLSRAKAGYIVNTYAIALLLTGLSSGVKRAETVLTAAAGDRRNLASGLSKVLLAFVQARRGTDHKPLEKTLSAKNKRLAALLGVADE
jgi:tetratricopeptide (TPR) repeat protein